MIRRQHLSSLLRRDLVVAHALVALGCLLVRQLPLFDVLGFEYAAAAACLIAYAAGLRACGVLARARPALDAAPAPFPGRSLLRLAAENATLVATPLAVAGLDPGRTLACNAGAGLTMFAVLVVPAFVYGTSLGSVFGLALPARRARIGFVLFSLATMVWALVWLAAQPPKFAFNAFIGYFPGPVYDAAVQLTSTLLVARGVVVLQAALALCLAVLGWDGHRFRFRRIVAAWNGERAVLGGLALGIVATLAVVWLYRAPLGLQIDRGTIQRTLGGRIETAHCTVFYDAGTYSDAAARRLADEHEARWRQLARWFELEPDRKVRSYVYASAEQKKRLMGAAGTSFEDALHDEFHINATRDDPHPTLTHEMAHIFAAQITPWVPVHWKIGIHEGIAVAAEWNEESARLEMTPHQACAAMDSLELLPDLRRSLSAFGFWTQAGARVYTACGSFVRWLLDTRGMEQFRVLWRHGDFQRAYGASLETLLDQWRAMLRATALGRTERVRAERLFRPGAIFSEPCAREQARLEAQAGAAFAQRDGRAAESLYARLVDLDPQDPDHRLALGRARLVRGDTRGAVAAAQEVLDANGDIPAIAERATRLTADAALRDATRPAAAESAYARGAGMAASAADQRAYEVIRQTIADSRLRDLLRDYWTDSQLPDEAGLALLAAARVAAPEAGLPRYLLGRRMVLADEAALGRQELEGALATGDLGPHARLAARELVARSWVLDGDPARAAAIYAALLQTERAPEWRRLGWVDWRERLAGPGNPLDP